MNALEFTREMINKGVLKEFTEEELEAIKANLNEDEKEDDEE